MRLFGFLTPAEQHRAAGLPAQSSGTQGFSQPATATQTEQSSSSPHQAEPSDSLRLGWLSSGPKPALQWLEAEVPLASEVLDGVTDPAPLNHHPGQAEQQPPHARL